MNVNKKIELASITNDPKVLEKLSKDGDYCVFEAILKNPYTPTEIIEKYSKSKSTITRSIVSTNPFTPNEILEKLSKDRSKYVKAKLCSNINIPVEILERLSDSKFYEVRENIASNISTPLNLLEKLSKDSLSFVKISVIKNSNCTKEILESLLDDECIYTRKMARKFYKKKILSLNREDIENIISEIKDRKFVEISDLLSFLNKRIVNEDRFKILKRISTIKYYKTIMFKNVYKYVEDYKNINNVYKKFIFYENKNVDEHYYLEQFFLITKSQEFIDYFIKEVIKKDEVSFVSYLESLNKEEKILF